MRRDQSSNPLQLITLLHQRCYHLRGLRSSTYRVLQLITLLHQRCYSTPYKGLFSLRSFKPLRQPLDSLIVKDHSPT